MGRLRSFTRRWIMSRRGAAGAIISGLVLIGTATASAGPPTIPPPPPQFQQNPSPGIALSINSDDGAYLIGKATVVKAKTTVKIPLTLSHAYASVQVATGDPVTGINPFVDNIADVWALSPKGDPQRYGHFPPVVVHTLAFGSLPVQATVHLSQMVGAGSKYVSPLRVKQHNITGSTTQAPAIVTGLLQLTLTDVTVDKVPFDVGSHCSLAQPLHIVLTGNHPAYGDVLSGGLLTGVIDIGPFRGCASGGDDVDPVLTGLLSGPGNPVSVEQGQLGTWVYPESCPLTEPPGIPPCKIPKAP